MRKIWWLILVVFLIIVFNAREVDAKPSPRPEVSVSDVTNTPTAIPAPDPTMVFFTGNSIDTTQYYAPRKNDICYTWNHIIGNVGGYMVPSGKQAIVIKFLKDQASVPMNNVVCENDANRTPEERASWLNMREPWYYPWSKLVTLYVIDNMAAATLTFTPTVTLTATETETVTQTPRPTETRSPTPTSVPSRTPSSTPTVSRTWTKTSTTSRTSTKTATPVLKPNWEISELVTTIIKPEKGDICWGKVVDKYFNVTVEFTKNYNSGIQLRGGGCFKSKYYPFSEVFFYLFKKGIKYDAIQLPEERKVTPTITLSPTITVIPRLPEEWKTVYRSKFRAFTGTICWGDKVADFEYKVVNFTKDSRSDFWIVNGACYAGEKYSPEDIYNYLKRNRKPINGIVNTP